METQRLVLNAAHALSISPRTLRRWISAGKMKSIKLERRVLLEPAEPRRLIEASRKRVCRVDTVRDREGHGKPDYRTTPNVEGGGTKMAHTDEARQCAQQLRDLAQKYDNVAMMTFKRNDTATVVIESGYDADAPLQQALERLLDDGWSPVGILALEYIGDTTHGETMAIHQVAWTGSDLEPKMRAQVLHELSQALISKLNEKPAPTWLKKQGKEYGELQKVLLDGTAAEPAENLGPKSGETPKKLVYPTLVGFVVISNDGDLAWGLGFWDHGDITAAFSRRVRDGIVQSPSPDQFKRDVPTDPRFHTPPQRAEAIEWMAAKIKEVLANGDKTQWSTAELEDIRHTLTLAIDQKRIDDPTFFTLMPAQQKSRWRPSQELLDELETRAARKEEG